jgi:uncharacterized protein YpmB
MGKKTRRTIIVILTIISTVTVVYVRFFKTSDKNASRKEVIHVDSGYVVQDNKAVLQNNTGNGVQNNNNGSSIQNNNNSTGTQNINYGTVHNNLKQEVINNDNRDYRSLHNYYVEKEDTIDQEQNYTIKSNENNIIVAPILGKWEKPFAAIPIKETQSNYISLSITSTSSLSYEYGKIDGVDYQFILINGIAISTMPLYIMYEHPLTNILFGDYSDKRKWYVMRLKKSIQ